MSEGQANDVGRSGRTATLLREGPLPPPHPHRTRALDVGAGIGRVAAHVVLLEPVDNFMQEARATRSRSPISPRTDGGDCRYVEKRRVPSPGLSPLAHEATGPFGKRTGNRR